MERPDDRPRGTGEDGFTLLEIAFALVLAVLMILALHQTVQVSLKGKQVVDRKYQITRLADGFLTRLMNMPFGRSTDPAPSAAELAEFFDDDEAFGDVTLHQIAVSAIQPGHTFTMRTTDLTGDWRIKVCNDLDGDGATMGLREGRNDLLRIEIWFEERLVLDSMRAAEVDFTTQDVVAGG